MDHHILTELNRTIKQRPVRDLAWALLNPPFFSSIPNVYQQWLIPLWQDKGLVDWLYALDRQPEPLTNHLKEQRATRLGIYFEQLLSFYFSSYPRFELLAKNLQVNTAKRTIGEYDFIVLDKVENQHYHIEVAVKFFIGPLSNTHIKGNTPIYNWHHWVGPNKKDSLGIKMNHLLQHQLRLSQTEAGERALHTIGLSAVDLIPKLLLTGRLYLPKTQSNHGNIDLPEYIQEAYCETGQVSHWLTKDKALEELQLEERQKEHNADNVNQYVILPRQLWMNDITHTDIENFSLESLNAKALRNKLVETIDEEAPPLHIVKFQDNKELISELKQQHFFVIP